MLTAADLQPQIPLADDQQPPTKIKKRKHFCEIDSNCIKCYMSFGYPCIVLLTKYKMTNVLFVFLPCFLLSEKVWTTRQSSVGNALHHRPFSRAGGRLQGEDVEGIVKVTCTYNIFCNLKGLVWKLIIGTVTWNLSLLANMIHWLIASCLNTAWNCLDHLLSPVLDISQCTVSENDRSVTFWVPVSWQLVNHCHFLQDLLSLTVALYRTLAETKSHL